MTQKHRLSLILTVNNWSRKVLPSGLSTNLKHLQVSQNVNKTQYEYIHSSPCGRKCMCVHVNNVNMTSRMRGEKYGRHENSNTSENIALNSSLNARRFGHKIYLQTVDRLGFSKGGNNIVDRRHCCPEPSWLDVKFSRVSLESALSNPRDAHWPTARSGWLPNVIKTRVRVYNRFKFVLVLHWLCKSSKCILALVPSTNKP